ncbi:protein of unknown function [Rhodospira trueperi]|uniref:DUF1127 domain-containing protein n=1 Tax=Rhodospira trueperi TaxID=69960 RepID=A0A1G7FQA3_9PROT|nr:protein of unknown function [Rhodospira trueperi]
MLSIRALLEAARMALAGPPREDQAPDRVSSGLSPRGRLGCARSRRQTAGLSDWILRDIGLSRVPKTDGRCEVRPLHQTRGPEKPW